jgi:hypothetical protein
MQHYQTAIDQLGQSDTNACVPIALSILVGEQVTAINNDMINVGIRRRNRGVRDYLWMAYAEDVLNLKLNDVTSQVLAKGAKTSKSVARCLQPSKRYLIVVRGHILAYAHGEVQDWSASRKKRLKVVYEVTGGVGALDCLTGRAKVKVRSPKVVNRKAVRDTASRVWLKNDLFDAFDNCVSVANAARLQSVTYANAYYYYKLWKKTGES